MAQRTRPATADEIAAERRNRRTPAPTAPPAGSPPAPVATTTPRTVVASRALVASHLGAHGAPAPTGGVFPDRPLVLEPTPATAIALPVGEDYVIATCDADESMVPPGCYTPVSRLLWRTGYRVRRDLYEAVLADHAARAAIGAATEAAPAELPPGADQLPPSVIAPAPPPAAAPPPPAITVVTPGGAPPRP